MPLVHGRNESYPLMNLESGKCLDSLAITLTQTDCNPSTTRRWKLFNNGWKQLCDNLNPPKCVSIWEDLEDSNSRPILMMQPLVGGENEWDPSVVKITHHISVENHQIRFIDGNQMNKENSSYCMASYRNAPPNTLNLPLIVEFCNNNYKNQAWSFVSFE